PIVPSVAPPRLGLEGWPRRLAPQPQPASKQFRVRCPWLLRRQFHSVMFLATLVRGERRGRRPLAVVSTCHQPFGRVPAAISRLSRAADLERADPANSTSYRSSPPPSHRQETESLFVSESTRLFQRKWR